MKKLRSLALVLVMVIGVVFMTGCGKKSDSLVGQWDHSGYVYTFNEDGTGNYAYGSSKMEFTYEDKGTEFSILYKGNTVATSFQYKIENDVLTIVDSFGSDVIYKRK